MRIEEDLEPNRLQALHNPSSVDPLPLLHARTTRKLLPSGINQVPGRGNEDSSIEAAKHILQLLQSFKLSSSCNPASGEGQGCIA